MNSLKSLIFFSHIRLSKPRCFTNESLVYLLQIRKMVVLDILDATVSSMFFPCFAGIRCWAGSLYMCFLIQLDHQLGVGGGISRKQMRGFKEQSLGSR